MKAYTFKTIHRCENITDWVKTAGGAGASISTTTAYEGKYALRISDPGGEVGVAYQYKPAGSKWDFSAFTYLNIWMKRTVSTTGLVRLYTDAGNHAYWNITFEAGWTKHSLDLSAPDGETGTLDLSSIIYLKVAANLAVQAGVDFDLIYCSKDVESKIANCYIWSPMYQKVAGSPPDRRPFGWDINVPYTNWDKRFQLCRIRIKPGDESCFVMGDILEIQDDNSVCCFYGRIGKRYDRTTSYIMDAWGWGDELMESIFKNAYSAKRTDEILIGQIDASSKSTQSSSIDQTTITYTYDVKIPTYALIDLARYLERGVFYRVPGYDSKCYFDKDITDVNLLPLATLIYPATWDFRDDTVGATGTDISWIDSKTATDSNPLATLMASEDSHKKVIKFVSDGDNGTYAWWRHDPTDQATGTIELHAKYIDKGQGNMVFYFYDSGGSILFYAVFSSVTNVFSIHYGDGAGGHTSSNVAVATDTWAHLRLGFNCTTDLVSCWVNETALITDKPFYDDLDGTALATYRVQMDGGGGVNSLEGYVDAIGEDWDTNYTVGQNLAQFSESHYCKGVRFIGKKSYNLGVTRAHVWGTVNSKEQVNKISSLTTEEQEKGSFPIFPYIDLSLTNYTEVNQLATALKNIFSTDTLFINWRVRGIGFMQWGYRIRARWNIKSSLPTTDDYMITEYIYDAKNDRYLRLILSNNTVFEREFVNIQKQLGRDIIVNASMMDSQASESTADGTVLRQRVLPLLIARAPIVHIVVGAPDANYDVDDGVEVGDLYIDTAGSRAYICLINTAGAADWNQID